MAVHKAAAEDTDLDMMDQGEVGCQRHQEKDLASRQELDKAAGRGMVHSGTHLADQQAYHMAAAADSHLGRSLAG